MTELPPHQQILELVERLRNGQDIESAEDTLQKIEARLQSWAERLQKVPMPPTHTELVTQILEESMRSLQLCADAVGYVRGYLSSGDVQYAEAAENTAHEAFDLMQQLSSITEQSMDSVAKETQANQHAVHLTFSDAKDSVRMEAEMPTDTVRVIDMSHEASGDEENPETVHLSHEAQEE